MPHVVVIMPARNAAAFVREAVTSVLRQTVHDLQLIVVDDGSTDGTGTAVRAVADERVQLITTAPRGVAHARNTALAAGPWSPWVAFIDADDVWDGERLAAQLAAAAQDPAAIALGSWVRYTSATGRWLGEWRVSVTPADRPRIAQGELFPFALSAALVRRTALARAGAFDETLSPHGAEDLDFYARLARVGPIRTIPHTLVSYRIHGRSFVARQARGTSMAARFVQERLACRDAGRDLSWPEFAARYRLTWTERRRDFAVRSYRATAIAVAERRPLRALFHGLLAVTASPGYTLPRIYRQRLLEGGPSAGRVAALGPSATMCASCW